MVSGRRRTLLSRGGGRRLRRVVRRTKAGRVRIFGGVMLARPTTFRAPMTEQTSGSSTAGAIKCDIRVAAGLIALSFLVAPDCASGQSLGPQNPENLRTLPIPPSAPPAAPRAQQPSAVQQPAQAADDSSVAFRIRSLYPKIVRLQFYSQDRKRVWPSADDVHALKDDDFHTFELSCKKGETICYGAWSGTTYWGTGKDDRHGCRSCCKECGAGTLSTTFE